MKCGGCKKRAYCSTKCQKLDWGTSGQCHRIWCKLDCCEEDIDWKFQEVPGKGLRLVALRDIPPLTRIIVERGYTWDEARNNPLLAHLKPPNESLGKKFENNSTQMESYPLREKLAGVVFFNISRMNHSCEPNSDAWKVDDNSVLYSKCKIRKGEEICFSFRHLTLITWTKLPPVLFLHYNSLMLQANWSIFCPKDCVCQTSNYLEVATETQKLKIEIVESGRDGNFDQMLHACKEFLALSKSQPRLLGIEKTIIGVLQRAYQLSLLSKKTESEAEEHLKTLLSIVSSIHNAESCGKSIPPQFTNNLDTQNFLRLTAWTEDFKMSSKFEPMNNFYVANIGIDIRMPRVRHCAFCLQEIKKFIFCGGCRKRAFCSGDCAENDLTVKGQGHHGWCDLVCGEEDLDWMVRTVLGGKGLGVIALRDFPKGSRIMVDRLLSKAEAENCPRVLDLSPDNGSFEIKFRRNSIGKDSRPGENSIINTF